MEIKLLACRNPKWVIVKTPEMDENNNVKKDDEGNLILQTVLDENGNPKKVIDVECQWSHLGDETQEFLHFFANPDDTEEHGRNLYQEIIDGKHGDIADE